MEEEDAASGARYYVRLNPQGAHPLHSPWSKPKRFARLVRDGEGEGEGEGEEDGEEEAGEGEGDRYTYGYDYVEGVKGASRKGGAREEREDEGEEVWAYDGEI